MEKTNVMRLLTQKKIPFIPHEYDPSMTDGQSIAKALHEDPNRTFKTLVTASGAGEYFVFVLPVCTTLDLKKAASAVGVKSVAMIPQKQLLPLTGYIHGGCSPIGMKKKFRTVIDESCRLYDSILCSAGKIGFQIELTPGALMELTGAETADITE